MNRFLYTLSRSTHSYHLSLSLTNPYVSQTRHKSNKKRLTPGQKNSENFWRSVNEYLDEIPEPTKRVKHDFLRKKMIDEEMEKLSLDFMNTELENPVRTKPNETENKPGIKSVDDETLASQLDSNAGTEKERRKDDKWRLAFNFLDNSAIPEPLSTYRGRPIKGPLNTFNTFKRGQRQNMEFSINDKSNTPGFRNTRSKIRLESRNRFRNERFGETEMETESVGETMDETESVIQTETKDETESVIQAETMDGTDKLEAIGTESLNEIGTKVLTEYSNEPETIPDTQTETIPDTQTETIAETKGEIETITEPQFPQYTYKDASISESINEYLPGIGTTSVNNSIPNIAKGNVSFEEMLQNSNLMKMGDPRKKNVTGIVISISGNQVYVDYGHKFYGVFSIPKTFEKDQFQPGTRVVVKVLELELTQQFLGETTMFSLLESGLEFVSLM